MFMKFSFFQLKTKIGGQLRSARAARVVPMEPLPVVPVVPLVAAVLPVAPVAAVDAPLAALLLTASLARAAGEGAVRTTVAVSLRGTAWRLAVAASCGVTPTVAGADAPAAGAVVWAEALAMTTASRAPKGIDLIKRFMVFAFIQCCGNTKTVLRSPAVAS
jgi:hypothetical protein